MAIWYRSVEFYTKIAKAIKEKHFFFSFLNFEMHNYTFLKKTDFMKINNSPI